MRYLTLLRLSLVRKPKICERVIDNEGGDVGREGRSSGSHKVLRH